MMNGLIYNLVLVFAFFVVGEKAEHDKHVQEGLYQKTYYRQFWNKLLGINSRYAVFEYKADSNNIFLDQDNSFNIYEMIDVKFNELKQQGMSSEKLEEEMDSDIERCFAKYLTKVNQSIVNLENLENIVGETIINVIEEIALFCEKNLENMLGSEYNIKTIPLVSTLHVLEATRKASLGYTLADVYNDTLKVNSFMDHVLPKYSADNPLDKDSYIDRNPILYNIIKKHAEKLYSSFDLKVNDDELCYLMMFFDPERRAN
jgi:hypothetical protein